MGISTVVLIVPSFASASAWTYASRVKASRESAVKQRRLAAEKKNYAGPFWRDIRCMGSAGDFGNSIKVELHRRGVSSNSGALPGNSSDA